MIEYMEVSIFLYSLSATATQFSWALEVRWQAPIFQVKLKSDGAARGSPGLANFFGTIPFGSHHGLRGRASCLHAVIHKVTSRHSPLS